MGLEHSRHNCFEEEDALTDQAHHRGWALLNPPVPSIPLEMDLFALQQLLY